MRRRIASINDLPIKESKRKYHWPLGRRPDDHPSLSDLGFYEASWIVSTPMQATLPSRRPSRQYRPVGVPARITPDLAHFIEAQTSIFLATANAEGQPYI